MPAEIPDRKRLSLIEYLYLEKPDRKLFVDRSNGRCYHVEEIYGNLLDLNSTLLLITYKNGKSRFVPLDSHQNDLESIAEIT